LEATETIMITDDDPINIEIIKSILIKDGYKIISTINGKDCIELLKAKKPDLLLLDIEMPDMNGLEVCRIINNDLALKDIPVIFVTAASDTLTLKEAFDSGGTDYVRKPINSIELKARIKSVLYQQKLKKELIAKEKLAGVLEMAGAVCHELNQPLQAIYIIMDSMSIDIPKDSYLQTDIKDIKHQILRIREITKKLMKITKYESREYIRGVKIIDIDKASV